MSLKNIMMNKMLKYKEFLNEKLSDKLSGFDEDGLKNQLEKGELSIERYLSICVKNNINLLTVNELIKYFLDGKIITMFELYSLCKIYDINLPSSEQIYNLLKQNKISENNYFNIVNSYHINIPNEFKKELYDKYINNKKDFKKYLEMVDLYDLIKPDEKIVIKQLSDEKPNTLLYYGFLNNYINIVKLALKKGADINSDERLLMFAIKNENFELIDLLIENGINIHKNDDYILYYAVEKGNLNTVKYLIGKDCNVTEKTIVLAAQRNYLDILKYFKNNNFDIHINNEEPLCAAIRNGNIETVKYLIENDANIHIDDEKPLCVAIRNGNIEIVKYLIENDANIHIDNEKPLYQAVYFKHKEIIIYLLEKGAVLNFTILHIPSNIEINNILKKYYDKQNA